MITLSRNKYLWYDLGPALAVIGLMVIGKIFGWMDLRYESGRWYLIAVFFLNTILCSVLFYLCARNVKFAHVPESVRRKLLLAIVGSTLVMVVVYFVPLRHTT